ncbi:MAG: alkaline phosphatase family protein [Thermoanaerobaculia bacterium]|nr:alkaline phosphatase family protein [Thermoanaerobaculia bacterium]
MTARLAFLQFDSAALPRLEQLLADGRLPTLAALRARGRWQRLDAGATFLQSSTYMTLCTGVDVREHGVYSAVPWSARDQRPRFMYAVSGPPTIWDRLTARGRRALVVDPILAWPPARMAGVFLGGWQFEDRMVARAVSRPSSARRRLSRRHGRAPRLDDVYGSRSAASLFAWREQLIRAPARVATAAIELMRQERFDFAWLNFSAAHKAGHHLWDPAAVVDEPLSDADQCALQDGLAEVYEAVDAAIARILEALPEDCDVVVFSPTGMGANTSRADLLPGMLDAVLAGPRRTARTTTGGARAPIWALRSAVPAAWRDRLARALPDDLVADLVTRLYLRLDGRRRRAIAVPGENKGYVRINLRGRERDGIVEPGEVDELLHDIAAGLLTFRDPDGSPAISRVERMSELATRGAALAALPDLVVHWGERPAGRLARVASPVHGVVERQGVGSGRSGNHVDDAWALLVPGRARWHELGRPARVTDLGATACALLDADCTGLSGETLLETTR